MSQTPYVIRGAKTGTKFEDSPRFRHYGSLIQEATDQRPDDWEIVFGSVLLHLP